MWRERSFRERKRKRILTFLCKKLALCAAVIFIFCVRCVWHITVFSETIDKMLGVAIIVAAIRMMTVELGALVIELVEEMTED